MLKRMLAVGLTVGLAVGILVSCRDETTVRVLGKGALITFIGDTPASNVLSFRTTVTGMALKQEGTANKATVFPSTSSTSSMVRMNFASLRDSSTLLTIAAVPETTYDQVVLTLAGTQIVLYDPSKDPPIRVVNGRLSTVTPVIPIQPALTVTKDGVFALRLDFDMLRAIKLDTNGEVSGDVTPVLSAARVQSIEGQGFGELDDLVGFVRSVSAYSMGHNFTGALTMQLLAGTGPAVTVYFTSSTELLGVPALSLLETAQVVEVDASVDENGNVVAKTVEAEDRAVLADKKLAFLGSVLSVTRDYSGNVAQFSFYVREEEPDSGGNVPLDSVVVVNVSSSTSFQYSSRSANFASLPFDATAVAPGQELIVHGTYTKAAQAPTTVDANTIYLKLQTMQGSLSSLAQIGLDDKTGGFWFIPSLTLLQGAPVLVLTNGDTVFTEVPGLGELTPEATLLVKGLPFYQKEAGTINGVTVPAGTLVVTARQIHQLQ